MFTARSINKYLTKLLPLLAKRYGKHAHYSASHVRATVYQCDFKTQYLPLGYVLALNEKELSKVFTKDYPEQSVCDYKKEILDKLVTRKVKNINYSLFES
ncbi:MAG: DUF6559 family protein [Thalassotalea sp.]